ncbi:hypothetical protein [Bacteroides caecimuris]|nr:hypothetical protein [Bacteroides caecimuris]
MREQLLTAIKRDGDCEILHQEAHDDGSRNYKTATTMRMKNLC